MVFFPEDVAFTKNLKRERRNKKTLAWKFYKISFDYEHFKRTNEVIFRLIAPFRYTFAAQEGKEEVVQSSRKSVSLSKKDKMSFSVIQGIHAFQNKKDAERTRLVSYEIVVPVWGEKIVMAHKKSDPREIVFQKVTIRKNVWRLLRKKIKSNIAGNLLQKIYLSKAPTMTGYFDFKKTVLKKLGIKQ